MTASNYAATGVARPHRFAAQSCYAPTKRLDQESHVWHAWRGLRSNGCCGEHGQCKLGTAIRPYFNPQTVQRMETQMQLTKTDAVAFQ
jgi:hypothetical protein